MKAAGEEAAKVDPVALMSLAIRIARRLAAAGGVSDYTDELAGVACGAVASALAGHDPSIGSIEPYAAAWIAGEVKGAIEKETKRREHETPLREGREIRHPALRAEELVRDVVDAGLSSYVDEELRANGEAGLFKSETWAALHREIDRLEPEDRRLVKLRYWDELTWKEVAARLGIAERTAQERDERIRDRLQVALLNWDRVRPIRGRP